MGNKPNILFFFTDQQRWDTVGCYGQPLDITPNLDRLASEGVKFEYAFTCQPVCGPARSCIQTGKYATETGCFKNHIALPLEEKTIAHHLSETGYRVGYIGKWHLASSEGANYRVLPVPPERRGGYKDFWLAADALEFTSHGYGGHLFNSDMQQVDFTGYRADCMTDYVVDYLNHQQESDPPFFLFVSYLEPHHQNDHECFEGPHGSKDRFKDFPIPEDLRGEAGDWRENYPDYLGCCASLDENLGRILDTLKAKGLDQNTVVLFTSDHGCHFRTRNDEYKRSCHENAIRIPMVAWGPGFLGGKVVDDLVSLIDIPPTLLACAGAEIPQTMRGNPLQWLLDQERPSWPQEIFLQISESQVGRAIRTKRWKYSVTAPHRNPLEDPGSDRYMEECLYDLEADPSEKNNLVCDPAYMQVRAELAQVLKRKMAEAGELEPDILPA